MIINQLEEIYLKMEHGYKSNDNEKLIISGLLGEYWCRFVYFYNMKVLVVVNTMTEQRLIYHY